MRRDWNHTCGPEGSGRRFSTALGCIATEQYVHSIVAVLEALDAGLKVRITSDRAKFDPVSGKRLTDYKNEVGDYLTVAYRFEAGEEKWEVEREPNFEGEQAAADLAEVLNLRADRAFCEKMVALKGIFDCIGGTVFIKPLVHEQTVAGYSYHYEHLVQEPGDAVSEPDPEEPEADPETPAEEHAAIEAERA